VRLGDQHQPRDLVPDRRRRQQFARQVSTSSSRMNTSSKMTSLKWCSPFISTIGLIVMPGAEVGRQAARSSMMRRRSAAGDSPVSRRTSREKWNSDA
jgi:hypothetical protein